MDTNTSLAAIPSGVSNDPIKTLSGFIKFLIAVPSAKNSGFDNISKVTPGLALHSKIDLILSAVLQGTVDFSTTILEVRDAAAILRVADSINLN
jgi:hypothetical protein